MYRNRISEAECQNRTNIRKHKKAMNSWVELHVKKTFFSRFIRIKQFPGRNGILSEQEPGKQTLYQVERTQWAKTQMIQSKYLCLM